MMEVSNLKDPLRYRRVNPGVAGSNVALREAIVAIKRRNSAECAAMRAVLGYAAHDHRTLPL